MRNKSFERSVLLSVLVGVAGYGLLGVLNTACAQQPQAGTTWKRLLQDEYAADDRRLTKALPPYSALPATLDLTGKQIEDGSCHCCRQAAWESRLTGIMGTEPINDVGVSAPSEATSTSLTTTDGVGPIYSLPARFSAEVVTGRVTSRKVCISQNRRIVYTRLEIQILQSFKGTARETLSAADFGGRILFPSGQLTNFLLDRGGFVGSDKQYIFFLWKPVLSDSLYVVTQAYLIEDGLVYPVSTDASGYMTYTKMPLQQFEVKVRRAVAKNIDTN